MLGLDDHPDALGVEVVLQPVGHLFGEPLLGLQAADEALNHPGQLRQAQDALGGEVAHVGYPDERKQMVLAEGVEGDVAGHDELVVALVVGGKVVSAKGRGVSSSV